VVSKLERRVPLTIPGGWTTQSLTQDPIGFRANATTRPSAQRTEYKVPAGILEAG